MLVPLTRAALVGDPDASAVSWVPPLFSLAEAALSPFNGLAAWLVWRRVDIGLRRKRAGLRRWGWFVLLDALWPVGLYSVREPALAGALLASCIAAACWTALAFRRLQPGSAVLLLPYIAWLAAMAGMIAVHF